MKILRKKLAKTYMFSRTAANLFRIHELRFAKKYLRISQNSFCMIPVVTGRGFCKNFFYFFCDVFKKIFIFFIFHLIYKVYF